MSESLDQTRTELPAEDYELHPLSPDAEPLLPQYSSLDSSSPSPTTSSSLGKPRQSPHERHELAIRHSAFRRSLSCLCLAVFLTVPSSGLAVCYFGRTTLDRVRSWEQVPTEVKQWLDKIVPALFPR